MEFDAERVWVAGSTVLASWHAAVTLRRTGERVRQRGFLTFELDDAGARGTPQGVGRRAASWASMRTFQPEPRRPAAWEAADGG